MMTRGQTAIAMAIVAAVFLAATLSVGLTGGTSAEEAVGLASTAPERWYPPEVSVAPSERARAPGLRSSHRIPVWGHVDSGGAYRPLMIDSHQGAWSFYPMRALVAIGGLEAARVGTALVGLLMVLAVFAVARLVAGPRTALLAMLLAATSGLLVWTYSWVRPDEQLDVLCHLGVVLAVARHAASGRVRWFLLACLLLGAGVAAKNTAAWTAFAMVVAAGLFRVLPRVRRTHWVLGALVALVPLVPQLLFMAMGDDAGATSSRLSTLSAPWHGLSPTQLSFSLDHFAHSIGSGGALVGSYVGGADRGVPVVGYLMLAAVLLVVGGAFSSRTPRAQRMFGAALGVLMLQYLALYYHGESFWLLVAPWVCIAVAVAGLALWNSASEVGSASGRRVARAAVVALGLGVVAGNTADVLRLRAAFGASSSAMFSLRSERWLADQLLAADVRRPFTTTYGQVGVLELLSDDAIRPRHLFPYFHRAGDDAGRMAAAWEQIFRRMGGGRHVVILVPNASTVETSPLRHGGAIAASFHRAVARRGAATQTIAKRVGGDGSLALEIVALTLPLSGLEAGPPGSLP